MLKCNSTCVFFFFFLVKPLKKTLNEMNEIQGNMKKKVKHNYTKLYKHYKIQ